MNSFRTMRLVAVSTPQGYRGQPLKVTGASPHYPVAPHVSSTSSTHTRLTAGTAVTVVLILATPTKKAKSHLIPVALSVIQ